MATNFQNEVASTNNSYAKTARAKAQASKAGLTPGTYVGRTMAATVKSWTPTSGPEKGQTMPLLELPFEISEVLSGGPDDESQVLGTTHSKTLFSGRNDKGRDTGVETAVELSEWLLEGQELAEDLTDWYNQIAEAWTSYEGDIEIKSTAPKKTGGKNFIDISAVG